MNIHVKYMTAFERLQAMESLWDALTHDGKGPPNPPVLLSLGVNSSARVFLVRVDNHTQAVENNEGAEGDD